MPVPVAELSLADRLSAIAEFLPDAFIGESLAVMLAVSRDIPWRAVSIFGFEWELNSASSADFLFSSNVARGGRDILARAMGSGSAGEKNSSPEWRAIVDFCNIWSDPQSVLFHGADDPWFEFDSSANSAQAYVPSFFFGPRVGLDEPDTALRRTRAILELGVCTLKGGELPRSISETLDRFMDSLPPHARVFQAGLMLSRVNSPLRVCVGNLNLAEIVELTRRLRGDEDAASVTETLERFGPLLLSVKPCFDLEGNVGPRVGLECYCASPQRVSRPQDWQRLLDELVASGMCSHARRDVLLSLAPLVPALQEEGPLNELAALIGRSRATSVKLHHVKVTLEACRHPSAKAYIAAEDVWLN